MKARSHPNKRVSHERTASHKQRRAMRQSMQLKPEGRCYKRRREDGSR